MTSLPIRWYIAGAVVLYALMSGMSDGYWHWSTLRANVHGDFVSLHAPMRGGETASVFDVVSDSASCGLMAGGEATRCDYRAGRSLHIAIEGIGAGDATVRFMRASSESAFHGSFGVRHGCVVVTRNRAVSEGPKYRNPLLDAAFISPATGVVYPDWRACMRTTRRGAA